LAKEDDALTIASFFHSQHAMAASLCPIPCQNPSGIETVETDEFKIHCLKTPTGFLYLDYLI
jgi:hypothetical protein